MQYLLFQLYGSMQSWGNLAVGEVRPTSGHPTRSAVLGLIAAALGLRHGEEERLAALQNGYGLAVRVDACGSRMIDYHTAMVPKLTKKNRAWLQTRRDEIVEFNWQHAHMGKTTRPNPVPSGREYLADSCFTACLWAVKEDAPHSLAGIMAALERPKLTPYLGRKACPFGLPMRPEIAEAADVPQALAGYAPDRKLLPRLKFAETRPVFSDQGHGGPTVQTHVVRDQVWSHGRRQFVTRNEDLFHVQAPKKEDGDVPE